jgi:hypothetical protein
MRVCGGPTGTKGKKLLPENLIAQNFLDLAGRPP